MVTATAAGMPSQKAGPSAKPAPFPHPDSKIGSFSFDRRVAALSFAARIFGAEPGESIPRVEVLYELPASGPLAEELSNERDPQEAFKKNGPVSWQHRGVIYFNGWRLDPHEKKRASALVHEMAHILAAVHAQRHEQAIHDEHAYRCATEGIATFAEIESRHASGIEWKGFPPGTMEEYILGFAFFNSVREAVGTEGAFHLIASNLPRNMEEIKNPQIYLGRVASEHEAAQAVA